MHHCHFFRISLNTYDTFLAVVKDLLTFKWVTTGSHFFTGFYFIDTSPCFNVHIEGLCLVKNNIWHPIWPRHHQILAHNGVKCATYAVMSQWDTCHSLAMYQPGMSVTYQISRAMYTELAGEELKDLWFTGYLLQVQTKSKMPRY